MTSSDGRRSRPQAEGSTLRLRHTPPLVLLLSTTLIGVASPPVAAASTYDSTTQSSLRNMVTAMHSWSMFDNNDSYEGVTVAVLADWGWSPSNAVFTQIWVEGNGESFRATAEARYGGATEFVYTSTQPFKGVGPGAVSKANPQPEGDPSTAGTKVFDLDSSLDLDALAALLVAVPFDKICDASLTQPGTRTARSSVPDHYLACEAAAAGSGTSMRALLAAMAAAGGAGALALIAAEFVGDGTKPAEVPDWVDESPGPTRPPGPALPVLPPVWRVEPAANTFAERNQVDQATARTVIQQCLALLAVSYASIDPHGDCQSKPIFASGRENHEATDHDLQALATKNPAWVQLNYRARADGGTTKWYTGDPACADPLPGQACDEYPFFSSEQGGGDAIPRPSLKLINGAQNSNRGSQYSGFLTKCRFSPTAALAERAFLSIPIPPVPGAAANVGLTTQKLCNGK